MANIKSQIKRNRQNDKRRLTNRVYRGEARIAVKGARTAMDASAPESKEELMKAISALDKAVQKGVIHKNNAARRKSRLMKAFAGMKPAEVIAPVAEPAPAVVEEVKAKSRRSKVEAKPEPAAVEKPKTKTASKTAASKKPAKADVKKAAVKTTAKATKKTTTTKKTAAK